MMGAEPAPVPTSWRDVYTLVRDTREDVLSAVKAVDEKVDKVDTRVDRIEKDRLTTRSAQQAEARILGKARSMIRESIAITISIVTAAVVVANFVTGH